ncbi:hypothetical protein B0H19DRAFT_1154221 [Mycena capillaripes]|nr:hypothetical protein B0H19DRAFT_1154221 [Mycena capillaripes]
MSSAQIIGGAVVAVIVVVFFVLLLCRRMAGTGRIEMFSGGPGPQIGPRVGVQGGAAGKPSRFGAFGGGWGAQSRNEYPNQGQNYHEPVPPPYTAQQSGKFNAPTAPQAQQPQGNYAALLF